MDAWQATVSQGRGASQPSAAVPGASGAAGRNEVRHRPAVQCDALVQRAGDPRPGPRARRGADRRADRCARGDGCCRTRIAVSIVVVRVVVPLVIVGIVLPVLAPVVAMLLPVLSRLIALLLALVEILLALSLAISLSVGKPILAALLRAPESRHPLMLLLPHGGVAVALPASGAAAVIVPRLPRLTAEGAARCRPSTAVAAALCAGPALAERATARGPAAG